MVFTGIEGVDWASLHHAYGDASDVPGLLHGLASPDPAVRESALDGMYGAVHHQGDVYDSTVACVPFLFELLLLTSVPGRGAVLELLCGIAGEEEPDAAELAEYSADFEDDEDDEEHADWVAQRLAASERVRGRSAQLFALLDDPDEELRAAVPGALRSLHGDGAAVLAALRRRLPAEPSVRVARALVAATGELGARHGGRVAIDAAACLLRVAYDARPHPELVLTALTGLTQCAPDRLPPDAVELAAEAMRAAREGPPPAPPQPLPRTDTLLGALRELRAAHDAASGADEPVKLLQEWHLALGDRTDERLRLLVEQLRSPSAGQRHAAIRQAGPLLSGWRLPGEEAVGLLAAQVRSEDADLARAALRTLTYLHPLAHGAADTVAEALPAFRHEAVETGWWETTRYGRAIDALVAQGDPRAVPELERALCESPLPVGLSERLPTLAAHAAPLGPVLLELLRATSPGHPRLRAMLLDLLAVPAPVAAIPLVSSFVDSDDPALRRVALRTMARFGPPAASRAGRIRELVASGPSSFVRLAAAEALWAITGEADLDLVLGAVREGLSAEHRGGRREACGLAARVGPPAASLAPLLRARVAADDERVDAARALWRVTGGADDADEVARVLVGEWPRGHFNRPAIAATLAELGPAAADAVPLAEAELARSRRHGNDGPPSPNFLCHVDVDEELQRDCRRILAQAPPGPA